MKKITSIVVSVALTVSMLLNDVQKVTIHADNPLAQNVYTADPAPMVHDGTLYLYTSHDKDGSDYFYMPDWQCYSTTDMQNWTHHGTVLSDTDFSYAESSDTYGLYAVGNDKVGKGRTAEKRAVADRGNCLAVSGRGYR